MVFSRRVHRRSPKKSALDRRLDELKGGAALDWDGLAAELREAFGVAAIHPRAEAFIRAWIDTARLGGALRLDGPILAIERRAGIAGMFLGGAYQEILGDLHNLFGDTNAVHVRLEDYGYTVSNVIKGDSIEEVLRYLQYDPEDMVERVRKQAERALNAGRMNLHQLRAFMRHYEESLRGYTYLQDES